MKITRAARPERWTTLDNDVIRDDRLSYRALGVLARLLSNRDGYSFDSDDLAAGEGREGRDAVRKALKELRLAGYLHQSRRRDPETRHWTTDCEVFDTPQTPTSEEPPLRPRRPRTPPKRRDPGTSGPRPENPASGPRTENPASPGQASAGQALSTKNDQEKHQQQQVLLPREEPDGPTRLEAALRGAGLTARWDRLSVDDLAEVDALVAIHGVDRLVRDAMSRWQRDAPALYASAWIPGWRSLAPPGGAGAASAVIREPCRVCGERPGIAVAGGLCGPCRADSLAVAS